MTKSIDVECLVLECVEYKENDALVTVCSEESIFTVYARGILKQASKNRKITQPFSKVNMTLNYASDKAMPMLIHGNVIDYYYKIQQDLVSQSICFVLIEMVRKSKCNDRIYHFLDACFKAFHNNTNPLTYACLCIKEILISEGIGMYVSGCVECGRKDKLEAISIPEGGFICHYCNGHVHTPLSKEELIQYYSLFVLKDKDNERFIETMEFTIDQFIFLSRWFEEHGHTRLVSLQFLNSIKAL
ncbi:MAG: DNA repair protein RecO [Holdemanella sp.]|nr:DNA repair protein RecO [Holdemanella sp.]